ncbi:UPF0173 metal-dependent hydrolase YtkL [Alicyclobacillus cellulosilyticus]|uniref:UPF0173 metal-dependent hydrolase GCM10010885_20990 n=1 Tax=Alicyclobacillus cellulosilyticus TaxID=1003997 RepID=A0A917KFP0_9BACL|nr:metal-dependent hydrolase [Alicyclobacillus cellulosilyticus]GGJ11482.1 UPF0173 metal-dependent hydrolase YtkL [Alicyclobacillus cellulosilyticus]
MKITYHGHACFSLADAGHTVVIDPFLSGNPVADVTPDAIRADAVLLTHGHGDHVGDAETIARRTGAVIIAPFELAMYFGRKGLNVHPMHLGGARTFPFGTVKLTIAFHGSGLETEEGIVYAGNPCGFLVTMNGVTFYHAGDTALFGDMKLIGERHRIDVAALPIGDNFTMGPEDAKVAASWLRARYVVPMHYNTFDLIRQDPQAFAEDLGKQGQAVKVMQPGETWEVPVA